MAKSRPNDMVLALVPAMVSVRVETSLGKSVAALALPWERMSVHLLDGS